MKRTPFAVSLLAAVLIVGCQENNAVNPLASDYQGTLSKAPIDNPSGTIELKSELRVPSGNVYEKVYALEGKIQYSLETMESGQSKLTMTADASLRSQNGEVGKIVAQTNDYVALKGKESYSTAKDYPVSELNNMALHVEFTVKSDGVQVEQLSLVQQARLSR